MHILPAYFHSFQGIIYIIGGSCDHNDGGGLFYEVMTVNLTTGDVGEVEDTIYGTNAPAAASSLNRIALCGGASSNGNLNYCQVYSPKHDRWACYLILILIITMMFNGKKKAVKILNYPQR